MPQSHSTWNFSLFVLRRQSQRNWTWSALPAKSAARQKINESFQIKCFVFPRVVWRCRVSQLNVGAVSKLLAVSAGQLKIYHFLHVILIMNEPMQFSGHSSDCFLSVTCLRNYFSFCHLGRLCQQSRQANCQREISPRVCASFSRRFKQQCSEKRLLGVVVNKLFSVHTWQFMRLLILPTRFSLSCASECELGVGSDYEYPRPEQNTGWLAISFTHYRERQE